MFLNFNSFFLVWLILEINLIIFCFSFFYRISKSIEFNGFYQGLYYFIVQTLGSIIFLLSGLGWFQVREILIISVFFKLGLFPFQIWFFNLISYLPGLSLFLILSFQKLPLFLFLCNNFRTLVLLLFLLNLVIGSIFLFFSKNFVTILGSSSIYSTFWIFTLYFWNFLLFSFFILRYFFFFFILSKDSQNLKWKSRSFFFYFISLIFLIGYPPFSMFFFKLYGLILLGQGSLFILFLVWIFTFLAVISYFYFFLEYFYHPLNLYYHVFSNKGVIRFIMLVSLFFFEVFFI